LVEATGGAGARAERSEAAYRQLRFQGAMNLLRPAGPARTFRVIFSALVRANEKVARALRHRHAVWLRSRSAGSRFSRASSGVCSPRTTWWQNFAVFEIESWQNELHGCFLRTMKKTIALVVCLMVALLATNASAGTVEIPKEDPLVSVDIPDSWGPEEIDDGVQCESPDQVATIVFEVTSQKAVNDLVDANVDWLMKEQNVEVDEKSQTTKDFESGGLSWKRISWDGNSEEYGPATVGFLFTAVGEGKILAVTYWISKKDMEKHTAQIVKIYESVKKISG
jgi:hypothetical protein